jgi:mycothiol synthase
MEKEPYKPQLCMKRPCLDGLPEITLPPGYTIRTSREGDGPHWARIIRESFANSTFDESSFERIMMTNPAYRPDRIFFSCGSDGLPCGTASAYRADSYGAGVGYIHYVGVCPMHAGKGLGALLSLAVLHQFRAEGLQSAVLQTDDFRLPAIKTYLKLGFLPLIVHENQPARWNDVFEKLGVPAPSEYGAS